MNAPSALALWVGASAVGSGLMAGFFLAFSVVVMRALGAAPPAHAVAVMQSINVVVINPWFLVPFLGTGGACAAAAVAAIARWNEPGSALVVVAALLYLAGTLGVTLVCNVPRNTALAGVAPESGDAPAQWNAYRAEWTRWNHVRTIAALLAAASFTIALGR